MDVIVILVLLLIVLALAGTIPLPWRIAEIVEPNRALMLTACIGLLLMLLLWRLVRWMSKITGLATKIVEKLAVVFSVVLAVTAIVMIMVYESPTLVLTLFGIRVTTSWPVAIYVTVSLITFFLYGYDKRMAYRGEQRVPEALLHFLELLGGWPGATLARGVFHHKISREKANFRAVTWFIAVGHVIFWAWWFFWR